MVSSDRLVGNSRMDDEEDGDRPIQRLDGPMSHRLPIFD